MSGLKLAIFDMDGTIMDSQDLIVRAMEGAFGEYGIVAPERSEILGIVGLSLFEAVQRLLPERPDAEVERIAESYKAHFIAQRAKTGGEAAAPLYPGAREAIMALHGRDEVLLGVATGKARRGLDHAFAAHDLDRYFISRQTADLHPSKPNPAMVLACLSDTGVPARQAVMIGDTSYDIEMGRAAGVKTIGVTWGYHAASALETAGADVLVGDFGALIGALDALWGEAA